MFSSNKIGNGGDYIIGQSLRFRSSASAYLSRTFGTPTNGQKGTLSFWMKRGAIGTDQEIMGAGTSSYDQFQITSDQIRLVFNAATDGNLKTTAVFRDPSAWYHIVLSIDTTQATASSRANIYVNNVLQTLTITTNVTQNLSPKLLSNVIHYIGCYAGSTTTNNLDGYMAEVNFIDGQQLTPSSFGATDPTTGVWKPRKYTGTYGTNGFYLPFKDNTNTGNLMYDYSVGYASGGNCLSYSEQFDNAVWVKSNVTITANSTTAPDSTTTADTIVPNTTNAQHYTYISLTAPASTTVTYSVYAKSAGYDYLGLEIGAVGANRFDLANGTVLGVGWDAGVPIAPATITSVGNGWYRCSITATTSAAASGFVGVWSTATSTANYAGNGTSGIYIWGAQMEIGTSATPYRQTVASSIPFWTPTNISLTNGTTYDWMTDTPTPYADGGNGRGNYATLNPLARFADSTTPSDGNLSASATNASAIGTIAVNSGKWYAECVYSSVKAADNIVGVQSLHIYGSNNAPAPLRVTGSVGYDNVGGSFSKVVDNVFSSYGAAWTSGDVIGVALDLDNNQITFYKNGVSQGAIAYTFSNYGPWTFANGSGGTAASMSFSWNFGQRPFSYTPPTGFKALNTYNLPDPLISAGNKYFDVNLRSGTSATANITGKAFQPDLVWIKSRSAATDHKLTDSVRGATKALISNSTGPETTDTTGLTAFNSSGYTVGADTNYNNGTGPATYVDWFWKKDVTSGFDIVTYTGDGAASRTIAHSLNAVPKFWIIKNRSGASNNWNVYHVSMSAGTYIALNSTGAAASSTYASSSVAPTSTVFTVKTDGSGWDNLNAATYVAYLFAEVPGFSSFGNLLGNGSTDGPFVYLGFRPRFFLYKKISTTSFAQAWLIEDTDRLGYNQFNYDLYPSGSNAEIISSQFDMLSNGFKVRVNDNYNNENGATYIYAAFAENPFKYALAR